MEEDKLKDLILENQDLIYSIIHKFRSKDYEDLFQVGCIGLINAYKRFDDRMNVKFTSYAYNYIVGEIYRHIINNKTIRMSPRNSKLTSSINKAYEYLTNHLGRNPTDYEMCLFLEIEPYKYEEIKNMMLIESIDYDNGYELINKEKISKDDYLDLKNALSNLTNEEKMFINARYFNNYTQQDLAKLYNTNQVKISREEKKILSKLKNHMIWAKNIRNEYKYIIPITSMQQLKYKFNVILKKEVKARRSILSADFKKYFYQRMEK